MTRVRSSGSLAAARLSLAHRGAVNVPRTPVARRLGAAPACLQCSHQVRRFNHAGSSQSVPLRASGVRQIRPAVFIAGQRRSLSSNPDPNPEDHGPLAEYDDRVQSGRLRDDDHQRGIIQSLQHLHDELRNYKAPPVIHPTIESLQPPPPKGFMTRMFGKKEEEKPKQEITADLPRGLYLYGDVGSGKTMLMDLFYDTLPMGVASKTRIHFHNFMQDVHKRLHVMKMTHGNDIDGIPFIAADIAEKGNVLCFDEFQCTDVADAMILRRLLESLMAHGVVLVTTSNRHPDELYKNGIQRESFIPCIHLLKDRLHVINLDSPTDYRKIPRPPSGVYHAPLDAHAKSHADKWFRFLGSPTDEPHSEIQHVWGRDIQVPSVSGRACMFTFDELIGRPKSAADYIELAQHYDAFIITEVPGMNHKSRDLARRFITFIDALYESRAKLVLTTAVPLTELFMSKDEVKDSLQKGEGPSAAVGESGIDDVYRNLMDDLGMNMDMMKNSNIFSGDEERFAFARALSRLSEMGSQDWVERGMGLEEKGGKDEKDSWQRCCGGCLFHFGLAILIGTFFIKGVNIVRDAYKRGNHPCMCINPGSLCQNHRHSLIQQQQHTSELCVLPASFQKFLEGTLLALGAMNRSQQASPRRAPEPPLPPASNSNGDALVQSMRQFSFNTASATALPPSPRVSSPRRNSSVPKAPSTNERRNQSPLRRSPSATSLDTRAASPTLLRKASMNSLKNAGAITPTRPSPSSSRRSSSAHRANGQNLFGKSPHTNLDDTPEEPPVTAESIATTYFSKELSLHTLSDEERPVDTIAILHDACYGHRYSRPRTTRAGLSTIVERPERIHASILGVCAAYVRLGERHAEGRYAPHPRRHPSNSPNIPFRIQKTSRKLDLSSPAVTNVHGSKWMEELKIMCNAAESKLAMNGKELARPQMNRGSDGEPQQLHEGDLYLCAESLNAMEGALGAVCEGVDTVFNGSQNGKGPKQAFVVIRPPGHHCAASYPSGFCWLNNVHVGIAHAALTHGLTHAAIIDFDLHHGDGSQSIAWAHNARATNLPKNAAAWKKTSIGYFSLHDINSYPCEMGDEEKVKNASICIDNAHGQNIWNVHLQPWKSEAEFWQLYETKYMVLLEKTRLYLRGQTDRIRDSQSALKPKAAIFLSAGFDASEWESSGMQRHKVNVPTEFYARLTRDVKRIAGEEGCSVDGRIISVLEGGYSNRALASGVLSHISGLAGSDPDVVERQIDPSGLGFEIAQRVGALSIKTENPDEHVMPAYDPSWWALPQLELLDSIVHPPPPPEPKKVKSSSPPTYFSPTQSSNAKIAESPKLRRSSSNYFNGGSPRPPTRPPSPPPPEVGWATATHELSKLLIPTDRQTMSCKPDELSAEATRVRRDRQSLLTPPASTGTTPDITPSTRMSLRERKAPKPAEKAAEEKRAESVARTSRRRTVAGAAVLATDKAAARSAPKPEPSYKQATKQSSRRLSLVSNSSAATEPATSTALNGARVASQPPLPNRPGSSQSSILPNTNAVSRVPTVAPVKRTRAPASSRDAPKTARAASRASGASKPRASTSNTAEARQRQTSAQQPTNGPAASADADIDSLTAGMKKVKINLTTKAQRDAKAAAAAAVANMPAPNAPAPELSDTAVTASQAAHGVPEQSQIGQAGTPPRQPLSRAGSYMTELPPPTPEPLTPHPSIADRLQQLQVATSAPLPTSSPPRSLRRSSSVSTTHTSTTPPQPRAAAPTSNVFIPYQPEGPTPKAGPRDERLKWLEPNTATPGPSPAKRGDLPVFSSTGAIPFATKRPTSSDTKREDDIWEVPETPGKM
ncbi:hypothetical protein V492_07371 [Pseudogymnoascus sp. VKM F-4246]|nr:hypothetical protein V492_07371 [Pseudogymnoascus sp. VKM F-4246]